MKKIKKIVVVKRFKKNQTAKRIGFYLDVDTVLQFLTKINQQLASKVMRMNILTISLEKEACALKIQLGIL